MYWCIVKNNYWSMIRAIKGLNNTKQAIVNKLKEYGSIHITLN